MEPLNNKSLPEPIKDMMVKIKSAQKNGDYPILQELIPKAAHQLLQQGEAPKALTLINEGLDAANEQEDLITAARLLGMQGMALRQIGNPKQAVAAFKKSEQAARKLNHQPILIDALSQIGKIYAEQGEFDRAVLPLEKAFRLAFENKDSPREMFLSGLQGDTYLAMGQSGKAMEFYTIGLEKALELNRLEPQCSYHIAIGKIYLELEEYQPAEKHFKKALDIGSRLNHPGYEFQAFENLLQMSIRIDDMDQVRVNGEQAVRLAREISEVAGEVTSISDLTDYFIQKGEYSAALPYLERGLELAREVHDQAWQLKMLSDQGIALYYEGDLEAAVTLLEQALEISVHLQKKSEETILRSQLSALQADMGDIQRSLTTAKQALELARGQQLPRVEGDQCVLLGLNYLELGQTSSAKKHFEDAVQIYGKLERQDLVQQVQVYLDGLKAEDESS